MAGEVRPAGSGIADAVRAALEVAGVSAVICDAQGRVLGSTEGARQHVGAAALARTEEDLLAALASRSPSTSVEDLRQAVGTSEVRVHLDGGPTLRVDRREIAGDLRVWLLRPEPCGDGAGRGEILGIASHDLRSPLANVRSYAGMVLGARGPPLDPRVLRALQVIARNADRGLALVDDLVDLGRSEHALLQLETEPADLAELLRLAFEEVRPGAGDRGVLLRWDVPGALPRIAVDPGRLRRAIRALLEAGIRRTPPGARVTLTAEIRGAEICVAVEDEGSPIDVREAALAFDRDHQILAVRKLAAGVSLALARVIARAHGGRVGCVPLAGRGAMHFLALPGRELGH